MFHHLFSAIAGFVSRFLRLGNQRFTVMFIPHSERKIFNFKISVFALVFLGLVLTGVLGTFVVLSTQFNGISNLLVRRSDSLVQTEASLELLQDEIGDLMKSSRIFTSALDRTLDSLGIQNNITSQPAGGGDLSEFLGVEEHEANVIMESSQIRNISAMLVNSAEYLEKIGEVISSQEKLLVELPSIWPLERGLGVITNKMGPAIHPFTKQMYLHKGVDIAMRYGTGILAAANGKVVERGYEPRGFGHYVVIDHDYGFSTKYAHFERLYVDEGDTVVQGQTIGTMGSSGLSTGPHLHYEVRIGSEVVDPMYFIKIKD
ncbi:MAG: M23 family metallopeptidase [Spirochaetales bacterium]|nr:M23 family metallopeptidase [Spirochaetales bacterium]